MCFEYRCSKRAPKSDAFPVVVQNPWRLHLWQRMIDTYADVFLSASWKHISQALRSFFCGAVRASAEESLSCSTLGWRRRRERRSGCGSSVNDYFAFKLVFTDSARSIHTQMQGHDSAGIRFGLARKVQAFFGGGCFKRALVAVLLWWLTYIFKITHFFIEIVGNQEQTKKKQ